MSGFRITVESREGQKAKSFTAQVLAVAFASGLWEGGKERNPGCPVLLVVACSPGETVPFRESLRLGTRAKLYDENHSEDVAFSREHGYIFSEPYRVHGADVFTVYLPDLCDYQPGSIDDQVRLVAMPAEVDVAEMLRDRDEEIEDAVRHAGLAITLHERRQAGYIFNFNRAFVGEAAIFVRYLAQRAECPPYPGLAFATQLYASALVHSPVYAATSVSLTGARSARVEQMAALRHIGFRSYVHPGFRASTGFAFLATQDQTTAWMVSEMQRYDHVKEGQHG